MKAKIVLAAIVAMMMVAVTMLPAIGTDVSMSATVDGTGTSPTVDYSWELPDSDLLTPGIQVAPAPGANVPVYKYAVVSHPTGAVMIGSVRMDTYYVSTSTFVTGSWATIVTDATEIQTSINDAYAAGIIDLTEKGDIEYAISCDHAAMYIVTDMMTNCDAPGEYQVTISACTINGGACSPNHDQFFEYLSGVGFAIDFNGVDYGDITPGIYKEICGDLDMATGAKPTIENTCNAPIQLCVSGTDMVGANPINIIPVGCLDGSLDGEVMSPMSTASQCFTTCIPACSVELMCFSVNAPNTVCSDDYSGTITLAVQSCPVPT